MTELRPIKKSRLFNLLLTAAMLSVASAPLSAFATSEIEGPLITKSTRQRLQQIEEKRQELHDRAAQARKKEQIAMLHLQTIKTQLNQTTGVLNLHKQNLQRTESKINENEHSITKVRNDAQDLSAQAASRLREIYEGERVGLLEMLFEVDSLPMLLDRSYYQERIAEMDKAVLDDLRKRAAALNQAKDKLGEQRNAIGDLVSDLAKKAMEITKLKTAEEQTAQKLRSQRAFYESAEQQLANESQNLEAQIRAMESSHRRSNKKMAVGSGSMAYPINAQVTSPFGWRRHPIFGVRKFHTGVDLAGPNHAAIRAADSGSVLYTGWYGGYGKVVIVSHGNGMATLYAHMSRTAVEAGQNVSRGDVVGYEGTTGFSTGPHLHFEVRVNGKPNNPLEFLH